MHGRYCERGHTDVSARASSRPLVAIIGAGFSGIAAAVALTRRGITDYEVFEEADGVGGTWFKNRYPGAVVDLESHIYSYSFQRRDWRGMYAGWEEVRQYLEDVATKWGMLERTRLNVHIDSAAWSEETRTYQLTGSDGTTYGPFDAVISAVGFLNHPIVPPFARGEMAYAGVICHTSLWPDGLSMDGKRVAVVGTGSSAVQVVEEAERTAASLTIFQLEPNWILPKGVREFTEDERRANRRWLVYWWRRRRLFHAYDYRQVGSRHARSGTRSHGRRARASLKYLQSSLASRPDLIDLVTPAFTFEGRRTVFTDTYYECLKSPKTRLIPHGVTGLTSSGVVDATGAEHEFDLVVLATGFDAANYLRGLRVTGVGGKDLHETWAGEPVAYLGMLVPGFPNFFMMYGPNTNASPLPSFYEAEAAMAARIISRLGRPGHRRVEVRRRTFERFNAWLQGKLARTVWAPVDSYFKTSSGKVVAQWPVSPSRFILATKLAPLHAVTYSD